MAGVVAMASVIEDFDTQPCKKSSKDGGNAVVKTITSYFSPVAKAVEKPFSPPRSNNIMDYFSRGALTSKAKTSPSEQPKEINHKSAEKHPSAEAAVKQPSLKRRRKATKAVRKLVAVEAVSPADDDSCFIVEESHENMISVRESSSLCGVLGSDTAALLAQLSSETCNGTQETQKDHEHHGDASSCGKNTSALVVKDKPAKTSVRNSRKSKQKEANRSESEEKVADSCLCDANMEVDVSKDSELNSSTVMISFEDFVRSQSEDKGEESVQCEGNKALKDFDGMDSSKSEEASKELSIQISPRTITIEAQMHTISHKEVPENPARKASSLTNRRKGARSPVKESQPTGKRKSNVVLEEEDLDLAVLESESTPKCPDAEKRQFMAAFRQPSLDGSKAKLGKNQAKQKQPAENDVDTVRTEGSETPENKKAPKPKRKGKKAEETLTPKSENNGQEQDASHPLIPPVRRSRREAVVRQALKASPATGDVSKDSAASPKETLVKLATPKTRKSKHGVYIVEMVCPPDCKESPIRIKLTRVHQNVCGSDKNPPLTSNASNDSKKQKKAKKLVEKAKAFQQTKKAAAVEVNNTLRRSSRTEAAIAKSYCEDEDSVICLEEEETASPQIRQQKSKTQKSLRSLNDVLGKDTKAPPGSKVAVPSQEKNARKLSVASSIFDESSQEGSENSQDDEQFRARREFLKSGLPDSFKKQIAKATATKEAYALSCSSFQPVIHLTQPPADCPLWSLPWPESPKLCHLKELCIQVSKPPPSLIGSFAVKKEPDVRDFHERSSGWRPEMSENVRQILVEEVIASNPPFPCKALLPRLLARRADHQHYSEAGSTQSSVEPAGGKRKRMDDEGSKVAKKQRATYLDVSTLKTEPPQRGARTRRSQRGAKLHAEASKDKLLPGTSNDVVVVLDDLPEDTETKEGGKEDVLWTEKYQPQHSSDIIGNTSSVRRLHSWLKEWKLHADREERNKQKEKKQEEGSNDSDWDCGEDSPLLAEDTLCNTVLITGPTGIGKTATVYACAQELGFKVFEVNASSQRSGRLILSQLKEATQSHQVDSQGVNAHKPTYFNSYNASNSTGKHVFSPRKLNSPRRVLSSPRKPPQSPRGAKKGGLVPTSLANFFKMGRTSNKEPLSAKQDDKNASTKQKKAQEDTPKKKEARVKSPATAIVNKDNSEEQSKKMSATSLILFEEVDVIFDEDAGFFAAIKTFMSTTKRPVILTTSDPAFSTMFDGNFEEIYFKTPSLLDVSSYLRLLCLTEDTRTDQRDVSALLQVNGCDIRQSLLQLQCWIRSAGGRHTTTPSPDTNQNGTELKSDLCGEQAPTLTVASPQPPCESGCTESLLGLLNIQPKGDIWELLGSQKDVATCWELLTESSRRGVNLLYSNMETLLPLPCTQLRPAYKPKTPSVTVSTCPQSDTAPSQARLFHSAELADCSDDGSPVKVSHRMKKSKRRHCFPDQDGRHSGSDSEESFLSLCKPQTAPPPAKAETNESLLPQREKRKPLTPEERQKTLPVSMCLESISDFFDNMSDIDSLLAHHADDVCRRNLPVSAALKDGMTDELRVEMDTLSWVMGEQVLEIQAAVEEMSFRKCQLSAAETLDRAQQLEAAEELTLPVASHREGCNFTQSSLCQPQLVQQRRDIIESLVFRGAFGTVGNRSAAAVDYLPALRTICRSEQLKEQGKVKRRFLHYLDSINLGLPKDILSYLATDF
ncbi:ATPase family AAA domain-containing protein 5 [Dunckerocampus dactyliophorus]|uniref:ATPase family AAA domain-containing protein 5 n=1 Tax=Dunckerocampus dactyliophorus TaxID=161453 RepID=UPI00240535AB|nr:ATPase family AAA domain-containing protein 5 [Dunckerocampus dactyliophorus]